MHTNSITGKLTRMNLLVSGAALLLACAAFISYDVASFRAARELNLSIRAQVIGANSASALVFNDSQSAENTLAALKADTHIISAGIYTPEGRLFAQYQRQSGGPALPPRVAAEDRVNFNWLRRGQVTVIRPIFLEGKLTGTVYFQSDLEDLNARLRRYGEIVALILAASLFAAYLISWGTRRAIAEPIIKLADTARTVTRDKNYSLRAAPTGSGDELAVLIETFNEMLEQIQERDAALHSAHERLNLTLKSSGVGTWSWDVAADSIAWDDYIHLLYGQAPGTLPARFKDFLNLIHPEDREAASRKVAESLKSDSPYDSEFRVIWPKGSIRNLAVRGKVYRDEAGKAARLAGVCWDITERKRTEDALRESEERYRVVAETATDAIITIDANSRILFINSAGEKIFGYASDEVLGRELTMLMPEYLRHVHLAGIGRYVQAGERHIGWNAIQLPGLHKSGREIPLELSIGEFNKRGERSFTGIARDITERKKAEEALSQIAAIVTSSDDAIIGKTLEGVIVSWNQGAEKIYGYTAEEAMGKSISILFPHDLTDELPSIMDKVKRGESVEHLETLRVRKDGGVINVSSTISPIRDRQGRVAGASAIARDVTERKRAEDQIKELNLSLERRVVERTAELEASNKELEAFTYSVSHDLRAPLRHIDGFSKLLVDEFTAQLPEGAREYLGLIRDATREMGQLVDDLLNLARVGRKELNVQITGLDSLVEEVFADLKRETASRTIDWKFQKLPFVECDPGLVRQVFANLLSNAVKFTRKREKAEIQVGTMQQNGEAVVFVRDNGVGFSMKHVDKLFRVFQRLHRQEDFEGTGVGLATIQRIVKKHGGRIWAEAELDRGACFYFTLQSSHPAGLEAAANPGGNH